MNQPTKSADQELLRRGFDHPCKETCSGWEQGRERGYLEGIRAAIEALVTHSNKPDANFKALRHAVYIIEKALLAGGKG